MNTKFYKLCTLFLFVFLISCSDDLKLYHERPDEPEPPIIVEPEYYWLLENIDYPSDLPGFITRPSQTFTYNDEDIVKVITSAKEGDPEIIVDYNADKISYSRVRESGSTTYYDSLVVVLNSRNYADYIIHLTYQERIREGEPVKTKSIDDSTAFKYDADGYLIKLESYRTTGENSSLSNTEEYTYESGNLVKSLSTARTVTYQYIYAYDDKEHARPTEFCYEMPFNVTSLGQSCWMFPNLPFISDYLGKRSKNNVIRTEIIRTAKEGAFEPYADINYEYSFNENGLVTSAKLSGMGPGNKVFEDLEIRFSYLTKEKK